MNVLVVNDASWDNFALVSKRLNPKCINPDHRINYFYGKHLKLVANICNQNSMMLIRRPLIKDNIQELLADSLKYTKFCIIFHNFTEYNTISSTMIDLCDKNKIPYFVFSEHCSKFYMNGEYVHDTKFKTCVRGIDFTERDIVAEILPSAELFIEPRCPKNILEVVDNLRSRYQCIKDEKASKKIVYDEDLVKERKKILKSNKEMSYVDYMASKKKWLKDVTPKR